MSRAELTGAKIQLAFADDAGGKQFEEFFRRLLEAERSLRHELGTTQIHGPTKFGKADGGKDCIFTVNGTPRKARGGFPEPLTWDEPGKTYYSLKTGTGWRQSVHQDVGYSGHLTGKKRGKDQEPKPPTGDLLAHVAGGNRYVIVISEAADDGKAIIDEVRKAFAHHMQPEQLPALGWEDRINFLDANGLAFFIRHHRPILPRELDRKLGLDWPRELHRFDDWMRGLRRELPAYVPDPERQNFMDRVADPVARVIRVFGPPGVCDIARKGARAP